MVLRTSGSGVAQRLHYESADELFVYDIIMVGGLRALVHEIIETDGAEPVLHCQRLWKLRLCDAAGAPVGAGFIFNEQRHHGRFGGRGPFETLIFEGGDRFRLLYAESEWPVEFDGSLVVERLVDG